MKNINVTSLDALAENGINKICLAIGVFDGMHKGHQLLLKRLKKMARQHNSTPVALTFYPHPRAVLSPENPPPLLVPPRKRIELLHFYGAEGVVTLSFSTAFANQSPLEFIRNCLHSSRVAIKGICVGKSWRFGAGGAGDVDLLHDFADRGHFDFEAVLELSLEDAPVSSTAIRRAVAAGLLERAAAMLGRPYSLCGTVGAGHHVAGAELEHPTANLQPRYGVMPPAGVYAANALINGKRFSAAVNIGISPTYNWAGDHMPRLEAHLIDFSRNIYGEQLEVELLDYLREERCFSSPAELKKQIEKDICQVTQITKQVGGQYGKA